MKYHSMLVCQSLGGGTMSKVQSQLLATRIVDYTMKMYVY